MTTGDAPLTMTPEEVAAAMPTKTGTDQVRDELAHAAASALNAYAEGFGSYKAFKRADKMLADYDARTEATK
jgi:hypothetical protein